MDEARAIGVLEWWVRSAKAASQDGHGNGGVPRNTTVSAELQAREDQTRRVLAQVLGDEAVPDILRRGSMNDFYWVEEGIRRAEYALGKLRTEKETRDILGSTAPTMQADALHPLIWGAAWKRWESEHYSDAVQKSATALSGYVKDQTGRYELGDADLMSQAFSLAAPQAGKPRLRWPGNDDDLTVKSMRPGILNMAQGVFAAIRNPAAHSTDEIPKQEALEQLATLSILARWIERCDLVKT
ncbi:TIGR02391 family protein [Microbacterium rhizosphaerae]|uniref:TIGR02391 family protein n=1 Tax=Microbacterium rhizosphaerae TaxID=1678237 RepID=A0ABZ0SMA4_9MICO|nr:TIGR02391 family protein [Microbacterium rhizosphaerae]WPR90248.1 TIGR02391 family protein [Microbacterium rhizosphaerae]